jgi:hypothetical protein
MPKRLSEATLFGIAGAQPARAADGSNLAAGDRNLSCLTVRVPGLLNALRS